MSLERVKRHVLRLLGVVSDQETEEVESRGMLKAQRIVYPIGAKCVTRKAEFSTRPCRNNCPL